MPFDGPLPAALVIAAIAVIAVLYTLAAQARDRVAVATLNSEVERLRTAYTKHLADAAARNAGHEPQVAGDFDLVPDSPAPPIAPAA